MPNRSLSKPIDGLSWHGFPPPTSSTNRKARDWTHQSQITNPYLKKFLTGVSDSSSVRSREKERKDRETESEKGV